MADDHKKDDIDERRKQTVTFLTDKFKEMYEVIKHIPKRTRSMVQYFNCPKKHRGGCSSDTAAVTTSASISDLNISPELEYDHDSEFEMVSRDEAYDEISPAPEVGDDPDAVMVMGDDPDDENQPAPGNGADPDAVMVIGDDPDNEIHPAPVNGADPDAVMVIGDDPVDEIHPASVNGADPDAVMVIGDDPDDENPPAPVNGADPDAEIENGDDPDAGIAPAPANGDDPDFEIENGGEEMPAEMREHIIEIMRGYQLQMVIEKNLTATDMRTDQGRLALPKKKVKVEFLTAAEERYLQRRDGGEDGGNNGLNYMETVILGPDLTENPIWIKKWQIGSGGLTNCLMNKWNSFAKTYELKVGNKVRIWSFRVDRIDEEINVVTSELRLALVKL